MTEYNVRLGCKGKGFHGEEVLAQEQLVTINLHRSPGSSSVSVSPTDCPHNTGGHGDRCKAAHPGKDKVGNGIYCPYSFDYPYVQQNNPGWKPPEALMEALRRERPAGLLLDGT